MAMDKMHGQIMEALARIEAKLETEPVKESAAVTLEQLMEIQGVGKATAEKILELIND